MGTGFTVFDTRAFSASFMPLFWATRTWGSFVRLACMWQFSRAKQSDGSVLFTHPIYARHRPELDDECKNRRAGGITAAAIARAKAADAASAVPGGDVVDYRPSYDAHDARETEWGTQVPGSAGLSPSIVSDDAATEATEATAFDDADGYWMDPCFTTSFDEAEMSFTVHQGAGRGHEAPSRAELLRRERELRERERKLAAEESAAAEAEAFAEAAGGAGYTDEAWYEVAPMTLPVQITAASRYSRAPTLPPFGAPCDWSSSPPMRPLHLRR